MKSFIPSFQTAAKKTEQIHLPVKKVKVNQVGYTPFEKKTFLYTTTSKNFEGKRFQVIRTYDGKVFEGWLNKAVLDKDSGDRNYSGDFSFLTVPLP